MGLIEKALLKFIKPSVISTDIFLNFEKSISVNFLFIFLKVPNNFDNLTNSVLTELFIFNLLSKLNSSVILLRDEKSAFNFFTVSPNVPSCFCNDLTRSSNFSRFLLATVVSLSEVVISTLTCSFLAIFSPSFKNSIKLFKLY